MDPDQIYMNSVFKKSINLGSAGVGLKGYNYSVYMIVVGSLLPYII